MFNDDVHLIGSYCSFPLQGFLLLGVQLQLWDWSPRSPIKRPLDFLWYWSTKCLRWSRLLPDVVKPSGKNHPRLEFWRLEQL